MPLVSMATIAEQAGVSKNTVSLALRDSSRISAATRRKVMRVAKKLGYQKNPVVAQLLVELRKQRPAGYQRTFALINGYPDADALRTHHSIPVWVKGCHERATSQGYRFDEFWMDDPELNGERLNRILGARGIEGIVLVGRFTDSQLPERFMPTWQKHPCVVAGVRTHNPTLSFCCVDHHEVVLEAMEQVLALGYRRPALVVDERIDRLVDGRFSSAMWLAQQSLPAKQRVFPFSTMSRFPENAADMFAWLEAAKPDVLLTLHPNIRAILEESGRRVPEDIGIAVLEKRPSLEHWAGIDQHNDVAAAAAVDLLISMIHNRESGIPEFPRATFIGGSWSPGETVRNLR